MLLALTAVLVSWLIGLALLRPVFALSSAATRILWLSLSWGFGALLCSLIDFFFYLWPALPPWIAITLEVLLLIALWWPRKTSPSTNVLAALRTPKPSLWSRFLVALAAACLLLFIATVLLSYRQSPNGSYDAWAIWTLHARLLFRDPHHWRSVLPQLPASHPDYPPFLPLSIVRLWLFAGHETIFAPTAIGLLTSVLPLIVVAAALATFKSWGHGAIALIFLAGTKSYLQLATFEYADLAVSLFFVTTFVLLTAYRQTSNPRILFLAGVSAAAAAWVKNEGELFGLCLGIVGLVLWLRSRDRPLFRAQVMPFVYGFAAIFLCVILYKRLLPMRGDVLAWLLHPHSWIVGLRPARLWLILKFFATTAWRFDGLDWKPAHLLLPPLLCLVLIADTLGCGPLHRVTTLGLPVLACMLLGYVFIYATSPGDLVVYLQTSLQRLFLQLWPAFIFLVFLSLRTGLTAPSPHTTHDASE